MVRTEDDTILDSHVRDLGSQLGFGMNLLQRREFQAAYIVII
jgi:hypothetical protein